MSSNSVGKSACLSAVKLAPAHLVTSLTTFPKSNAPNFQRLDSSTESAFQGHSWGAVQGGWHGHSGENYPVLWQGVQGRSGKPAGTASSSPPGRQGLPGKGWNQLPGWAMGFRTRGSWKQSLDAAGNSWGFWQVAWANWTGCMEPNSPDATPGVASCL